MPWATANSAVIVTTTVSDEVVHDPPAGATRMPGGTPLVASRCCLATVLMKVSTHRRGYGALRVKVSMDVGGLGGGGTLVKTAVDGTTATTGGATASISGAMATELAPAGSGAGELSS